MITFGALLTFAVSFAGSGLLPVLAAKFGLGAGGVLVAQVLPNAVKIGQEISRRSRPAGRWYRRYPNPNYKKP